MTKTLRRNGKQSCLPSIQWLPLQRQLGYCMLATICCTTHYASRPVIALMSSCANCGNKLFSISTNSSCETWYLINMHHWIQKQGSRSNATCWTAVPSVNHDVCKCSSNSVDDILISRLWFSAWLRYIRRLLLHAGSVCACCRLTWIFGTSTARYAHMCAHAI